jgi:hypothetical protein
MTTPSLPDRLFDVREAANCDIAGMLMVCLCPERRLEALPLGTRVVLTSGKVATLVACSSTRAVVRLDTGAELEVAPGAELEVVAAATETAAQPLAPGQRGEPPLQAEAVSARVTDAPAVACSAALAGAAMRQTGPLPLPGCPAASDAFAHAPEAPGQGTRPCACGVWFMPRRPWQRYHARGCRQRAYDDRRRSERQEVNPKRERRA